MILIATDLIINTSITIVKVKQKVITFAFYKKPCEIRAVGI